jgi:hypothetical protein
MAHGFRGLMSASALVRCERRDAVDAKTAKELALIITLTGNDEIWDQWFTEKIGWHFSGPLTPSLL